MTMMMNNNFAQKYANNYVETAVSEATPHKLVDMLYEGAVKNLTLVRVFIEQKNYAKKAEHVNKTLSIISNLRDGLELEKGGEVAQNLYGLYDFAYRRLFEASAKNDVSMVDEVLDVIKPIREAWNEMPDNFKRASKDQLQKLGA
jgi:flagellar protein FliS